MRMIAASCLALLLMSPAGTDAAGTTDNADNAAMNAIHGQDQADRSGDAMQRDPAAVFARDRARRDATLALVREGRLHTATDYFRAAVVFQHSADDIRLAHALATIATTLDPGDGRARWLVAASWDRLLMQRLQPQWYGTQYQDSGDGVFLFPIADGAVDDEERRRMDVPTLGEARARLDDMAKMMGRPALAESPTIETLRERSRAEADPQPAAVGKE